MGEKFDDVMYYIGITILIGIIIGAGLFIVYERVDRGCWNLFYEDEIIEEFDMKDYSCEKLKEFLLLEVFPKEVRKTTIHQHCDGEIIKRGYKGKMKNDFYYEYDYKNKYRETCLDVKGK